MGDKMYTVEKIENNIVTLEDRINNSLFDVEKNKLPSNIKEGDILDLINDKYIINEIITKEVKNKIRNKFNSLTN